MDKLIRTLIGVRGATINKELRHVGIPATESAFVQARDKLLPEAMEYLFHEFSISLPAPKTFKGKRLLAVDGSTFAIPHNRNSKYYYEGKLRKGQKEPDKGVNLSHANCVYDVLNKIYLDCSIGKHERAEFIRMLERMDKRLDKDHEGYIFTGDRGYEAFNVFEHINRCNNMDFVIRVVDSRMRLVRDLPKEELDIERDIIITPRQGKDFKSPKHIFVQGHGRFEKDPNRERWDFDEDETPMHLRIVRFQLPTGKYETLITSLDRFNFSIDDLKEIYRLRWRIETSFMHLKYAIGGNAWISRKDEFLYQELFAKLIAYNYVSAIAQLIKPKKPQRQRKHKHKLDFSMAVNVIMEYFLEFTKRPPPIEELLPIFAEIEKECQRYTIADRPGRKDKRKMKPKSAIPYSYKIAC